MDLNDIRSAVTLFSFAFFIALAVWAWRPARREDHAEAAQLALVGEAGFAVPRGEAAFAGSGARDE